MNKFLLTLLLSTVTAGAEPVFQWFGGDESALLDQKHPPLVVDGEIGSARELEFQVEDPLARVGKGNYIAVPLERESLDDLTIALFVKLERNETVEDFVSCRTDSDNQFLGFRLIQSWRSWGFQFGDGSQIITEYADQQRNLLRPGHWQHIAVTFSKGVLSFYLNGKLLSQTETPSQQIALSPSQPVRIGAGLHEYPELLYPFSGRMAGVYIALEALDEEAIFKLMEKANH